MIIAGSRNKGNKLVNAILRGLQKDESVEVAAVSERGVRLLQLAGQNVANKLGSRISAVPRQDEITIDGVHRIALVVTLTKTEEGSAQ